MALFKNPETGRLEHLPDEAWEAVTEILWLLCIFGGDDLNVDKAIAGYRASGQYKLAVEEFIHLVYMAKATHMVDAAFDEMAEGIVQEVNDEGEQGSHDTDN